MEYAEALGISCVEMSFEWKCVHSVMDDWSGSCSAGWRLAGWLVAWRGWLAGWLPGAAGWLSWLACGGPALPADGWRGPLLARFMTGVPMGAVAGPWAAGGSRAERPSWPVPSAARDGPHAAAPAADTAATAASRAARPWPASRPQRCAATPVRRSTRPS